MHISVFEYGIQGFDDEEWGRRCEELAPAFAAVPGLASKVWLKGDDGRYGGVYLWQDADAYRAFLDSDLGRTIDGNPAFVGLTKRDWAVDEAPTRITRGLTPVPT